MPNWAPMGAYNGAMPLLSAGRVSALLAVFFSSIAQLTYFYNTVAHTHRANLNRNVFLFFSKQKPRLASRSLLVLLELSALSLPRGESASGVSALCVRVRARGKGYVCGSLCVIVY